MGADRLDFDIEGSWTSDEDSVTRRSKAIARLQEERSVHVWYTLPVMPSGLPVDALAVVQDAIDHGVVLDGVNLMTMDRGTGTDPDMGDWGKDAMRATKDQLAEVWPELTGEERWARIGATPMIGQNDIEDEVFTLSDAEDTLAYAIEKDIGLLSMWSANRDHPCDEDTTRPSSNCCGLDEVDDWAYSAIFAGF